MKGFIYNFFLGILIILSASVYSIKSFSQVPNFKIEFTINGSENKYVYLYSYNGDDTKLKDSAQVNGDGYVMFYMGNADPAGLYGVAFGKRYLDFIFNKESINIKIDTTLPVENSLVISSVENKIYFEFLHDDANLKKELRLLSAIIDNLDCDKEFHTKTINRFNEIQNKNLKKYKKIITKNADLLVSKFINVRQDPIIDGRMNQDERISYLKTHYFDNVHFDDISLVRSNVYTSKIISYLSLFSSDQYLKSDVEVSYENAIDSVFKHIDKKNKYIYNFILYFLVNGFEKYGFENVVKYLSEQYVIEDDKCEGDMQTDELQKRLEGYKKLAIEKQVPDISFTNIKNENIKLSEIKTDYILILFWASWCPHCDILLPKLKEAYNEQKQKKFEVIAISVDTVKEDYNKKINSLNCNWINYCDYMGWNGKIVNDFYVYATPTMYFINNKKEIISKPINFDDFINDAESVIDKKKNK